MREKRGGIRRGFSVRGIHQRGWQSEGKVVEVEDRRKGLLRENREVSDD